MPEDPDRHQTEQSDEPHESIVEERADLERLLEMMLETEVRTPEEDGYGHGV